jgi:transposase
VGGLAPLIPEGSPGGRPRKTDMRAAMNAIFYLLRTGCPWRYLPRDSFPPRSTVYNIFRRFQLDASGRRSGPNCIWRCASGWAGRPAPRLRFSTANRSNRRKRGGGTDNLLGYDVGKQVKGCKIHGLVDSEGLPMRVVVPGAANPMPPISPTCMPTLPIQSSES